MKVVTPAQMREIDRRAISEAGIPGIVLMENAAIAVVSEIIKTFGGVDGKTIVVIAGKGNNGGDAFAAARHLLNRRGCIKVYIPMKKSMISGDALVNLNILENMGTTASEVSDGESLEDLKNSLKEADIVIDGLFGTGFKGQLSGVVADVIEAVNMSGKPVISIDVPSGLDAETGKVTGVCVKADKTVTFGFPKTGLLMDPGRDYVGELVVADISLPYNITDGMKINVNTIEDRQISKLIPERCMQSSKGDYGRVFIVTGSTGMTGAGCLAASAALRVGAGLVYLGVPASLVHVYDSLVVESVTIPLEDGGTGHILKRSADRISYYFGKADVAAVGPGLSVSDDICELVSFIIRSSKIPLILDADALNAIARDLNVLKYLSTDAVITPHPGEMSRLTGISIKEIQNNRIEIAGEFARKWNVITVLKGSCTIIAMPDGTTFVNTTGNPGMATGGTGDVLTGTIAGLAAQGMKLIDAVVAGVYLHGKAGNLAAADKGEHGLIAGDVAAMLPYAIKDTIRIRGRMK